MSKVYVTVRKGGTVLVDRCLQNHTIGLNNRIGWRWIIESDITSCNSLIWLLQARRTHVIEVIVTHYNFLSRSNSRSVQSCTSGRSYPAFPNTSCSKRNSWIKISISRNGEWHFTTRFLYICRDHFIKKKGSSQICSSVL